MSIESLDPEIQAIIRDPRLLLDGRPKVAANEARNGYPTVEQVLFDRGNTRNGQRSNRAEALLLIALGAVLSASLVGVVIAQLVIHLGPARAAGVLAAGVVAGYGWAKRAAR